MAGRQNEFISGYVLQGLQRRMVLNIFKIKVMESTGFAITNCQFISFHRAFLSPSHRTVHDPSSGKPGLFLAGAPSHPAAIMATA